MNKRQVKKQMKALLENLKEGQGLIVGNESGGLRHYFNTFDIVDVIGTTGFGSIDCSRVSDCMGQCVSPEDIIIK